MGGARAFAGPTGYVCSTPEGARERRGGRGWGPVPIITVCLSVRGCLSATSSSIVGKAYDSHRLSVQRVHIGLIFRFCNK